LQTVILLKILLESGTPVALTEALQRRRPKRGAIIRIGVDDRRSGSVVLDLQVGRKGVSCRR